MQIKDILVAPAVGAFFNDDQEAIGRGAKKDGEIYVGAAVTCGFSSIRQTAEALSVGLVLSDGFTVWGDAMSVQYAGAGGRDTAFNSKSASEALQGGIRDRLLGRDVESFLDNSVGVTKLQKDFGHIHVGLQYGLSQAFLGAAAHANNRTYMEQVCSEFKLPIIAEPVPVYAQSGDNQYGNVDKMILKRVDILPHGLVNCPEKFGLKGDVFLGYVEWVCDRIRKLGPPGYEPCLYFDVYGMPGVVFENDISRMTSYFNDLEQRCQPFRLRIESPVNFGSLDRQVEGYALLRRSLRDAGCNVEIIVDEWCNSLSDIEQFCTADAVDLVQIKTPDLGSIDRSIVAVRTCKETGVGAYLGGSCTETDISARYSVHLAMAARADMILAKPGMGVDEALMIVGNEQARLLAILEHRDDSAQST